MEAGYASVVVLVKIIIAAVIVVISAALVVVRAVAVGRGVAGDGFRTDGEVVGLVGSMTISPGSCFLVELV